MDKLLFVGISGSLRKQSRNSGLLRSCIKSLPDNVEMEVVDLHNVPFYNEDIKETPFAVDIVLQQFKRANALVLAATEYNYSIAPALKNILDWASIVPNNTLLSGKKVAIVGAGGRLGSARSQYHLRQVCQYLNLYPLYQPEVFCSAFSNNFDQDGNLIDNETEKTIHILMSKLKDSVLAS